MKKSTMTGTSKLFGAALLALVLLTAGCADSQSTETGEEQESAQEEPHESVAIADTTDINELGINEDTTVYREDDPDSVVYFYVTVRKGDVGSDTAHTFDEVKSAVRFAENQHVADNIFARAIVQVGDENGPVRGGLGYGAESTNATIRIRGNSSSLMPQKSYQLKLDDETGLWRGQQNIALNKSAFDATKFRNKLYFDMLRDVPDVPSIRTQFARLFIKDETSGAAAYEDYGFYTQAEVPNKKYLANHGLDKEGYLYKAISFNFEPNSALKNFDDPDFDQEAFDQVLSCKGRQDNQKLIDLVDMISDTSVDINEIIGTYIDRENYLSWLAYNILVANIDTTVQNFYLYSPTNSDKWYFVPWDGDNMAPYGEYEIEGAMDEYSENDRGIRNYWGVLLHQRFLKYQENRKDLAAKVEELHEIINRETVNRRAAQYNSLVEPYISEMPDIYYLGATPEERQTIIDTLGDQIENAYDDFYESLDSLMPFFLLETVQEGDRVTLNWSEAYDFDNEEITYHLTVSQYPDMRDPLIDETLEDLDYKTTTAVLLPGTYYETVTAVTPDGKTATPKNKLSVGEEWYPGVERVEVK